MHLLLLSTIAGIALAEPISLSMAAGISASASAVAALILDNTICWVKECCDNYSIISNTTGLQQNLEKQVFGQPLVKTDLLYALEAHLNGKTPPSKALALSFHGPPGTGKNYVINFIAEAVFKLGTSSKFFHFLKSSHFSNKDRVTEYKDSLHTKIEEELKACGRSIFVFDDVQLLPPSVLDVVSPYIDGIIPVNRIKSSKAIFIFVSNIGSTIIINRTLEIRSQGKLRKDIQLKDFENLLRLGAYNEEGGLHGSQSIKAHLIDFFIPFLPLEQEHVKMCIHHEFAKLNFRTYNENTVQSILEDLVFVPGKILFSSSGCKRVASRVKVAVQKHKYNLI